MQKARYLIVLSCASTACGTEVATAVYPAPTVEAGTPGLPDKPPVCPSPKIIDRRLVTSVQLTDGVRYKRTGYFFGFPQDDRIALSASNNNGALLAWVDNSGTQVHVTPLSTPELVRSGDDVLVPGSELSGLVALDDGFALLTRRADPGDPLVDAATQPQATFLVRWQKDGERFALPLTGTRSIVTGVMASDKRDYAPSLTGTGLSGRLAFNGSHFGAYFAVRGAANDKYDGIVSDKFVQVDDKGQFVSGWRAACRQNLGGRLLPEANGFAAFCMSDGYVGATGLNAARGERSTELLASEWTSAYGYAGGNLGSAVKLPDGYLVAWASRGVKENGGVAFDGHQPAVALVTRTLDRVAEAKWPFAPTPLAAPREDAVNVHAAPYGDDKVLLIWETITEPQYRNGAATGNYGGTHFRLVDVNGQMASEEEHIPEHIAPNGSDDIVQLPNRDLIWAYVPEERNFKDLVVASAVPALPVLTQINLVRLTYCTP
jgi:hypothetical protein